MVWIFMKPITSKTIRLLSRSGLVLIFLSMIGGFALAAMRISRNLEEQTWNQFFGLLFLAVSGIAIYYISLSVFGWIFLKGQSASAASGK